MLFDMEPKGRNYIPLLQCPRLSALLRRLIVESSAVLVILTVPALAVLVSCDDDDFYNEVEAVTEPSDGDASDGGASEGGFSEGGFSEGLLPAEEDVFVIDSLKTRLNVYVDTGMDCGISTLDYFIYSSEGTRSLEMHKSLTMTGNGIVEEKDLWSAAEVASASASPRTVVVIANCPRAFNMDALRTKDSMDLLEFAFVDDDPSCPVMSGEEAFTPGGSVTVRLTPLLARVRICSVTNGLRNYQLLEDPSVRLCDLNPRARVLQMKDFNPVEFISEGALHRFPTDVGFYTQHPDVSLFCYPNDSPEVTLGLPPTTLEFNCRIEGTEYTFPFDLPPLPRGSLLDVDLIIDDPFNRRAIFSE